MDNSPLRFGKGMGTASLPVLIFVILCVLCFFVFKVYGMTALTVGGLSIFYAAGITIGADPASVGLRPFRRSNTMDRLASVLPLLSVYLLTGALLISIKEKVPAQSTFALFSLASYPLVLTAVMILGAAPSKAAMASQSGHGRAHKRPSLQRRPRWIATALPGQAISLP